MIAQLNRTYIKYKPSKAISRLISYFFFEGRPITTKGQFINPFLFFFFRMITHLPQVKKINKPIFIIGMGRSGTTILGNILSMHSDLGFLNEPKAIWHIVNSKDDLIGSYSDKKALYKLGKKDANQNMQNKIHKIYAFYLRTICTKRVLDKYPEMIFRTSFVKKLFPDAKFLFIYRNGWDTASSSTNWSDTNSKTLNNNETHNWWGKNNRKWNLLLDQVCIEDELLSSESEKINQIKSHTDKSIVEWILTMNQGSKLLGKESSEILGIKYENLVDNPEQVLNAIFNHCELDKELRVIDYAKSILRRNKKTAPYPISEYLKIPFDKVMLNFNYV